MVNEYRDWLYENGFSSNTVRLYTHVADNFGDYIRENGKLSNSGIIVSHRIVNSYINNLSDAGYSNYAIASNISAIKTYTDYLGAKHICSGITSPHKERKAPGYIDEDSIVKIVNATRNARDKVLVMVWYDGAMMLNEIVGLMRKDVSIRKGSINVSGYEVPLSKSTLLYLDIYIDKSVKDKDYVFYSQFGKPMDDCTAVVILHKMCDRAGVERIKPNVLRHSRIIDIISKGGSLTYLQNFIRHWNTSRLTDYYKAAMGIRSGNVDTAIPAFSNIM